MKEFKVIDKASLNIVLAWHSRWWCKSSELWEKQVKIMMQCSLFCKIVADNDQKVEI